MNITKCWNVSPVLSSWGDYGVRVMRADDEDGNNGMVPLTRADIEGDGVPFMAVIRNTHWLMPSPADIIDMF